MSRQASLHFQACLLGGALGDAFGWPIEFMSLDAIRRTHGTSGLTEPIRSEEGIFEITDDTQMTLFTVEGLLASHRRSQRPQAVEIVADMHAAYQRWLRTQTEPWLSAADDKESPLLAQRALWHRRAPGNTCIASLVKPSPNLRARNDSKGCGTVMKTAPIGLLFDDPFQVAESIAAITHGHPTAQLAAGALSEIIAGVASGASLTAAVARAESRLVREDHHEETLQAIRSARRVAEQSQNITPAAIESLGGGWIAEEALAIAIACAMRADDFEHGVRMAVNHSGDSDSTGAIAGNILGLIMGLEALPKDWLQFLELRDVIESAAIDLHASLMLAKSTLR